MQIEGVDEKTSPLNREQASQFNRLLKTLSPDQTVWLSGYLAGVNAAHSGASSPAEASEPADAPVITILYGSETGNAQQVAEQAKERAEARGLKARVFDMADYKPRELKSERLLMVVTATHGEGDPPDPAESFHEFLYSRKAPKLQDAKFAVLGLGDSSYDHFCQTGKDFDARLAELGAERLCERVDCDVDYDEPAEKWIETALDRFGEHVGAKGEVTAINDNVVAFSTSSTLRETMTYGRKNPFPAEVLENLVLTGRGSEKETRHLELSLEGSGFSFEPGDVLCVVAQNRPEVVAEMLEATGLRGVDTVETPRGEVTLEQALLHDFEITTLTPPFLKAYAGHANNAELERLLDHKNRRKLSEYRWGRHVIDVVQDFPVRELDAQTFVNMLRPLQPRDYSIASSFPANPDEVHLTVAAVRYHSYGRDRFGVASTYLCERAEPGEKVPVYVKRGKNFKLPDDPSAPIIMIGPGTGIAPFRAFVEEREYFGADGANWLFFGEQHFRTDFLYQTEWQRWLRDGALTRMDVAFSRDQAEKVYVQHRLQENARDLYAWLQDGAYIYVCGDAERMAPAVHATLCDIVAQEGGMSKKQATDYVKTLQREKRYQRDVY